MSTAKKALQRAWIVERRGRPSQALKLRADWEVPTKLNAGEVLVKVQAAALNPVYASILSIFVVLTPRSTQRIQTDGVTAQLCRKWEAPSRGI